MKGLGETKVRELALCMPSYELCGFELFVDLILDQAAVESPDAKGEKGQKDGKVVEA